MRRGVLLFGLLCARAFAGYSQKATVTFTGATGSTQTDITLAFAFSDVKLKTVANGGQIQNLCSRNGLNVPCDFVFTNDTTCATVTGGYAWDFDGDYSATAGTGHGWLLIPSLTTSGVTPTVCIGNTAVSTYQGVSAGPAFDSNTKAVWHLADGTTLAAADYSGSGNGGTITNATATAGKIAGAALMSPASAKIDKTSASGLPTLKANSWTIQGWHNTSSFTSLGVVFGFGNVDSVGGAGAARFLIEFNNHYYVWGVGDDWDTGISFDVDSTWHQWAITYDGTNLRFYRDGVLAAGPSAKAWADNTSTVIRSGFATTWNVTLASKLDEERISATARSANWIATEYANQSAPPAIGAFTAVASAGYVANQTVISIQ